MDFLPPRIWSMTDVFERSLTEALLGTDPGTRTIDRIMPQVYAELRDIAHRHLSADPDGHTLSTTALIHEAYLRLAEADRVTAKGRAYFFAAAARAMRQVLVDYARRRNRLKRGGGARPLTLDEGLVVGAGVPDGLIDLDRALESFADVSPRAASVVECRFFGGLSTDEIAQALDVTSRTVKRDWAFARAWLFDYLSRGGSWND